MITVHCGDITFTKIQAIIFDKDGTLENSHNFLRELAQKRSRLVDAQIPGIGDPLLMAFGLMDTTLDPQGLMAVGSRQENEIAAAAYIAETGRSWPESLEITRQAFRECDRYLQRTPENAPLFPGTREMLQRLSQAGLRLGILSADSSRGVNAFIERHQLSPYFHLAMGIESHDPFKPDPRLFLKACERLGVKPEATLMVGDSALDMEMGLNAGAAGTIGTCWDGRSLAGAQVTISSFEQLQVSLD